MVFQAARQAMEFDRRERELICQVEELQLDVHRLNNMVNPILPPDAPAVEEDPNVLIAKYDGMEVDTEDEPKDEEIEPFEDDQVMVCPTSTATTLRSSLALVFSMMR